MQRLEHARTTITLVLFLFSTKTYWKTATNYLTWASSSLIMALVKILYCRGMYVIVRLVILYFILPRLALPWCENQFNSPH